MYFNRKETNFIDFVDLGSYVYQYKNVADSFTASGIEINVDYIFSNQFKLKTNATYTHIEENLSLRIPEFKINASLMYELTKTTLISFSYQFNDSRKDAVYNSNTYVNDEVLLESYNLFDFYISHKFMNNKVLLFANVTNIFNAYYEELRGYSTRGRNVNLGLNINL